MSYNLGNTDAITYNGAEVECLTLDGDKIWEKPLTNGYINQSLDGVIYKQVPSLFASNEDEYLLFFSRMRIRPHYGSAAGGGNQIYAQQVMAVGRWNSSTKTWSHAPGKTFAYNVLVGNAMYDQVTHAIFYSKLGNWTAPISPDGSTSYAVFPNGGAVITDHGYKGQMISITVLGYLITHSASYWSTSNIDPRVAQRPQDMDSNLYYSSVVSTTTSAGGLSNYASTSHIDAAGNGVQAWSDGHIAHHTNNADSNSARKLILEAVVDMDTINFPADWFPGTGPDGTVGPAGLMTLSEAASEYPGAELPFNFPLYQK